MCQFQKIIPLENCSFFDLPSIYFLFLEDANIVSEWNIYDESHINDPKRKTYIKGKAFKVKGKEFHGDIVLTANLSGCYNVYLIKENIIQETVKNVYPHDLVKCLTKKITGKTIISKTLKEKLDELYGKTPF